LVQGFKARRNLRRILSSGLLAIAPWYAAAADSDALLQAWLGAQSRLKSWQASFTQTRTLKTLQRPLITTGRLWVATPNQFRWELGDPPRTIAMRNGADMLVIYPQLKRAERYSLAGPEAGLLGEALALLDAGFPADRASFDARFRVKALLPANATWQIELEPARASTRRVLPLLRLWVATNDFSLIANEVRLPDGSRMRNDFTNATANSALEPTLFTPTAPAGFTITEPTTQ
jgi:outer membrane lipoprotein-sorting protein